MTGGVVLKNKRVLVMSAVKKSHSRGKECYYILIKDYKDQDFDRSCVLLSDCTIFCHFS